MPASAALDRAELAPAVLRAPLFSELVGGLSEEQRHVVLDLGPARAGLIERLGLLRCRLDILDLPRSLARLLELQNSDDENQQLAVLVDCLPSTTPEPAGVVLCWDLLDYLPLPVTLRLFDLLGERDRLAPGARLHALVEYAAPGMPGSPRRVGPNLDGDLLIDADHGSPRPSPRHSLGTLVKHLPGFQSERSMLLANGMQEYLFRFSAS